MQDGKENIRDLIVSRRKSRVARLGYAMGEVIPRSRRSGAVPFTGAPIFLCEVKRRSPSKGVIAAGLDAAAQAGIYVRSGATAVSVLTEPEFFGGSLTDLISVKEKFPGITVLRKDFLISPEDIDISHRAGADAVLLIAAILDTELLESMYHRARDHGMDVLMEVHDMEDVRKCEKIRPRIVGINSRNLATFRIDRTIPPAVKAALDWECRVVFESGITCREDALYAGYSGFTGILVGESVVRNPDLAPELKAGLEQGITLRNSRGSVWGDRPSRGGFWEALYARRISGRNYAGEGNVPQGRPLIKICGITREADAVTAEELGADGLGFIFAPSPRRAEIAFLERLSPSGSTPGGTGGNSNRALRVGVVTADAYGKGISPAVLELLEAGIIDAIQFHGDEKPGTCAATAFPYYKAVRLRDASDIAGISDYRCPRVLIDAWAKDVRGGTGKLIQPELVRRAAELGPLWLAGGISPDNVGTIIRDWNPELIDASSRLEASPGIKDENLLQRFFRKVQEASRQAIDREADRKLPGR